MNSVHLIGRLTKDPDLRYTASGMANCRFTLAVDRNYSREKKAEAEAQNRPTADFIGIVVWGKVAENCGKYLQKGRKVAVVGSIQTGSYTAQDGSMRYTTDVNASNVEFLEWGERNANDFANQDNPYSAPNAGNRRQDWNKPSTNVGFGGNPFGSDFSGDDFISGEDSQELPF